MACVTLKDGTYISIRYNVDDEMKTPETPRDDVLMRLRDDGLMCDAILRINQHDKFPVHRAILSTCSPYFLSLFTYRNFKYHEQCTPHCITVDLEDVTKDTMQ